MNIVFNIGVLGQQQFVAPVVSGMPSARYFRIDNVSYVGATPQIYYMAFLDGGTKLIPSSLTTIAGDSTTSLSTNENDLSANLATYTYYDFDFGVDVDPDEIVIRFYENDTDYISSFDVSVSPDNVVWTKIGDTVVLDGYGVGTLFDGDRLYFNFGVEDGVMAQPAPYVVLAASANALIAQSHDAYTILGGYDKGVAAQSHDAYVITKPV
jgi:hypothetical protein